MNKQSGFTLIELIMVIVILGILAATAIPRFIDLSSQASQAAAEGVAGALAAGSAINYAACQAGGGAACESVSAAGNCADLGALLQGGFPAGFTPSGSPPTCTITHSEGGVATATLITTE